MKTVSFTQFRQNASSWLDLVEQGETVRILRHGKPVAKLVPSDPEDSKPNWKRPGLRLVIPGVSLSDAIIEERRSGR